MIKAIIFDCFGVVVGKGVWRIYELAGGDLAKDAEFLEEVINKEALNVINSEQFHKELSARVGMSFQEWKEFYVKHDSVDQRLIDYIAELRKNYKTAMLSNSASGVVNGKLNEQQRAVFDEIIISADVGYKKPDPRIFSLTAKRLGVEPNECLFTDDHAAYLDGASAVGMQTVLYKGLDTFKEELVARKV